MVDHQVLMVDCHHSIVDHQLNLLAMMVNHIVNFFAIFNLQLCELIVNYFNKVTQTTREFQPNDVRWSEQDF